MSVRVPDDAGSGARSDTRRERLDALASVAIIIAFAVALGWLTGFAWLNRSTIAQLWYEAAEQRHLTMAGEVGPVTYLVMQSDFAAFERAALALDGVLGVELRRFPDIAAVAFTGADSSAIDTLARLPSVTGMERRFVPMICH